MRRRTALKLLAGGLAGIGLGPSWASATRELSDFFIFIHAGGGWDVMLWADPRTTRTGLIEHPSVNNTDTSGMLHWKRAGDSFEPIETRSGLRLGPAIGRLFDHRERLTVVNGLAMNTVSHEDGATFSATGRHRSGGASPESSVDVLVASERGTSQLMPSVSIRFPSIFVGRLLDSRSVPLRVTNVDALTRSIDRSTTYLNVQDRSDIAALLTAEASALANESTHRKVFDELASQHRSIPDLISGDLANALGSKQLQAAYPQFEYRGFHGAANTSAAFAVEALKRNLVRSVAFGLGGFDTHLANHRQHGLRLQELFGTIASLLELLDRTPHPTASGAKLSDSTHILVISEFCRTPQLNQSGGRDHYPNNSALVISPRFRPGRYGSTDEDQLLPAPAGEFLDGQRAVAPPDLLATFVSAFGIDPRRYMRDGEVIEALLR